MALNTTAEADLRIQTLEAVVMAMIYTAAERTGGHDQAQAFIKGLEDESMEVLLDNPPPDGERQRRLAALHEAFFKGVRHGL